MLGSPGNQLFLLRALLTVAKQSLPDKNFKPEKQFKNFPLTVSIIQNFQQLIFSLEFKGKMNDENRYQKILKPFFNIY